MSGERADRSRADQGANERFRRHPPVPRIGSAQDLINHEQNRLRSRAGAQHLAQAFYLGHEVGLPVQQRIRDRARRTNRKARKPGVEGSYRRSRRGQYRIEADRSQERALACHIRTAHQIEFSRRIQPHVIAHANVLRNQRVAQPGCFECNTLVEQLREYILRMLMRVARERIQSLELAPGIEPVLEVLGVARLPTLDCERELRPH